MGAERPEALVIQKRNILKIKIYLRVGLALLYYKHSSATPIMPEKNDFKDANPLKKENKTPKFVYLYTSVSFASWTV